MGDSRHDRRLGAEVTRRQQWQVRLAKLLVDRVGIQSIRDDNLHLRLLARLVRNPARAYLLHSFVAGRLPPLASPEDYWTQSLRDQRLAAVTTAAP